MGHEVCAAILFVVGAEEKKAFIACLKGAKGGYDGYDDDWKVQPCS